MHRSVAVSVDIGSSSVRCSGYEVHNDKDSNTLSDPIASCSYSFCSVHPQSGKILIENDDNNHSKNLFAIIDDVIDDVLKKISSFYAATNTLYRIDTFGFSTFVMNLIAVDTNCTPIGSDYTLSYACNDRFVSAEVNAVKNAIGDDRCQHIYRMTGAPIHSAYALAQMIHTYKNDENQKCCQISKWLTIASICISRWTGYSEGDCPISYSEASWTGLLNYRTCQYEKAVTDLLPDACQHHLPSLADYNENNRTLDSTGPYWNRWAALQETKFCLGLGDGACANIGSKCTTPNRIACTVGTSAASRICIPLPISHQITDDNDDDYETAIDTFIVDPGLFCYRIDKNLILVGGAITDGGSVVEWIQKLLRLESTEEFQQCIDECSTLYESDIESAATTGSTTNNNNDSSSSACNNRSQSTITVVPFLSGERSVGFRSGASGTIHGITRATTSTHLVKACLEGVIARLTAVIDLLQRTIEQQNFAIGMYDENNNNNNNNNNNSSSLQIYCSGKALEVNDLWRQMLADSTGLPLVLQCDTFEGTVRGAAIMAVLAIQDDTSSTTDGMGVVTVPPQLQHESISSSTSTLNQPNVNSFNYWQKQKISQSNLIDSVSCLYND